MTSPEPPKVTKVSPTKSGSQIKKWLLVNTGFFIVTAAAAIIIAVAPKASHGPASTVKPTPRATVATVSGLVAFQSTPTALFVSGTASNIPPSKILWIVLRPVNVSIYYPLTQVDTSQSKTFAEQLDLTNIPAYQLGNGGFIYAMLCDQSANLIFEQSRYIGTPILPRGAVPLAITQIP
jgi:hypothetical protein